MATLLIYCADKASAQKAFDMVPKEHYAALLEPWDTMPYVSIDLHKHQHAFYAQNTGLTLHGINTPSITIPNEWLDPSNGMTIL